MTAELDWRSVPLDALRLAARPPGGSYYRLPEVPVSAFRHDSVVSQVRSQMEFGARPGRRLPDALEYVPPEECQLRRIVGQHYFDRDDVTLRLEWWMGVFENGDVVVTEPTGEYFAT